MTGDDPDDIVDAGTAHEDDYGPMVIETADPRCPCVLLLDTSGSMEGERIEALTAGLAAFRKSLLEDDLASRRVEIAIVTFDDEARLVHDFEFAEELDPPEFEPKGLTHLGEGVELALQVIADRKAFYKSNGVDYFRPWLFLITDGLPAGEDPAQLATAIQRLAEAQRNQQVAFFSVGVAEADVEHLGAMLPEPKPMKLKGLAYEELFDWLSKSLAVVSGSRPGAQQDLPEINWGKVAV